MHTNKKIYAVIWANSNIEKYGYIVFKDLLEYWWVVIPINPSEPEVLWIKTYPRLVDYDWIFDTVIFVTPPNVSEKVLQDVKLLGIKQVWFQPWSENQNCIDFCKQNNINYVNNACIMKLK